MKIEIEYKEYDVVTVCDRCGEEHSEGWKTSYNDCLCCMSCLSGSLEKYREGEEGTAEKTLKHNKQVLFCVLEDFIDVFDFESLPSRYRLQTLFSRLAKDFVKEEVTDLCVKTQKNNVIITFFIGNSHYSIVKYANGVSSSEIEGKENSCVEST